MQPFRLAFLRGMKVTATNTIPAFNATVKRMFTFDLKTPAETRPKVLVNSSSTQLFDYVRKTASLKAAVVEVLQRLFTHVNSPSSRGDTVRLREVRKCVQFKLAQGERHEHLLSGRIRYESFMWLR